MAVSLISGSPSYSESKLVRQEDFNQTVQRAAKEPLETLRKRGEKCLDLGRLFVCLARPKMALSQLVGGGLREGWKKVGADSVVNTALATGYNAALILLFVSGGKDLREMRWARSSDIAKWHVPTPSPQTLVKARRVAEAANRTLHVSALAAKGIQATAASTNWVYRQCYNEDLLPELPSIPPEITDLLLGTQSSLSFSQRLDAFFTASLISNPIVVDPAIQEGWLSQVPLLNFPGIVLNDLTRLNTNLRSAVNDACRETLEQTREERLALIESLEGVALSFLYKKIVAKLPGKEILIREVLLSFLQTYLASFYLPYLPAVANVDFVESLAGKWGALVETIPSEVGVALGGVAGDLIDQPVAGVVTGAALSSVRGALAKQLFLHGATKGLEYGPAASALTYQILYQELDQLASRGNQRLEEFSSFGGWWNLVRGNASPSREGAPLDPNQSYLTPIVSEFVLGTISRLSEGKGITAVLFEAMREMRKEKSEELSSSEPLAGMEEAKTQLTGFLASLSGRFIENLQNRTAAVIEAEKQLQMNNATEVSGEIEKRRGEILDAEAALIAGGINAIPGLFGVEVVSPESVKAALDPFNTVYKYLTNTKQG